MAYHDGYKRYGIIHKRMLIADNQYIIIKDELIGDTKYPSKAYLHFHPEVEIEIVENIVKTNFCEIIFEDILEIKQEEYFFSEQFNQRRKAIMLTLLFQKYLTTIINYSQSP